MSIYDRYRHCLNAPFVDIATQWIGKQTCHRGATSSLFFFAFRGDREKKIYRNLIYTKCTMKMVQLRTTINNICIIILAYLLCVNAFNGHSKVKKNLHTSAHILFSPGKNRTQFNHICTLSFSHVDGLRHCVRRSLDGHVNGMGAVMRRTIYWEHFIAQKRNSVERGKQQFHVVHTSKQLNLFIWKCLSRERKKYTNFPNSWHFLIVFHIRMLQKYEHAHKVAYCMVDFAGRWGLIIIIMVALRVTMNFITK